MKIQFKKNDTGIQGQGYDVIVEGVKIGEVERRDHVTVGYYGAWVARTVGQFHEKASSRKEAGEAVLHAFNARKNRIETVA